MFWDALFVASKPLFVGTTIVGAAAAIVTYFVALGAIREIRHLRTSPTGPSTPAGPSTEERRR